MKGKLFKTALIVHNKPLYQLHVLEKKDPHFTQLLRKKHITTKKWKPVFEQHQATLETISRTLQLLGIEATTVYRKDLKKIARFDLVITVGGDGTFLETSHLIKNQLLLGVNAAPTESTGALCYAKRDTFLTTLIDLITGDLKPKQLPRLKVKVGNKILPHPALNEILFSNQSPAGTSRYMIQIGKKMEEHKSSGVWVATGLGSTAALRSAGGQKMSSTRQAMQYVVREIFPETGKNFRLLKGILSKKQTIRFFAKMRQGAIYVDGNHLEHTLNYGDQVEISVTATPLKAVVPR